mmetsp:Transcript_11408/g.22923  ORF Transcript_11408/g.22923 Transcript_11408/m.22923 type:complete len:272 (+) Transcript_11408:1060-1875(+)
MFYRVCHIARGESWLLIAAFLQRRLNCHPSYASLLSLDPAMVPLAVAAAAAVRLVAVLKRRRRRRECLVRRGRRRRRKRKEKRKKKKKHGGKTTKRIEGHQQQEKLQEKWEMSRLQPQCCACHRRPSSPPPLSLPHHHSRRNILLALSRRRLFPHLHLHHNRRCRPTHCVASACARSPLAMVNTAVTRRTRRTDLIRFGTLLHSFPPLLKLPSLPPQPHCLLGKRRDLEDIWIGSRSRCPYHLVCSHISLPHLYLLLLLFVRRLGHCLYAR